MPIHLHPEYRVIVRGFAQGLVVFFIALLGYYLCQGWQLAQWLWLGLAALSFAWAMYFYLRLLLKRLTNFRQPPDEPGA